MPLRNRSAAARFGLLVLAVLSGLDCSRNTGGRSYIARVDNAELTEAEVAAAGDTLKDGSLHSREYVNDWIIRELLYQEALRRGVDETAEFKRQLEDSKRGLAIASLLDKELYDPGDTLLVSDDSVATYFNNAKPAFILREDVILASYVLFTERDAANGFRAMVLRGTSWNDAVRQVQQDSVEQHLLLQVATRQYFTQSTLYPPELWKVARSLGKEEVSFAVKTDPGYYIVKLYGIKHQGELPDLDYVKNEVRERLLIEQRKIRYDRFIAALRARHSVDIRLDRIDTSSTVAD